MLGPRWRDQTNQRESRDRYGWPADEQGRSWRPELHRRQKASGAGQSGRSELAEPPSDGHAPASALLKEAIVTMPQRLDLVAGFREDNFLHATSTPPHRRRQLLRLV